MMAMNRTNPRGLKFYMEEIIIHTDERYTRVKLVGSEKALLIHEPIQRMSQGFYDWQNGMHIQHSFSFLSPGEREFLMTGITDDEWDEMFRKETTEGIDE